MTELMESSGTKPGLFMAFELLGIPEVQWEKMELSFVWEQDQK